MSKLTHRGTGDDLADLRDDPDGAAKARAHIERTARPAEEVFADTDVPTERRCRVQILTASDVRPEPIDWLWPDWLAKGKFHVLAGSPGTGKTTIALALGAAVSKAGRWPDGSPAPQGDVLIWSGEDDPKDTLIPRLLAAGGNPGRMHFVAGMSDGETSRPFDPARDLPGLAEFIHERNVRLLIVDPVVSAVAGDSHQNAEVRRSLQPLVDLGQQTGCAVLGITHLSKGTAGRDPLERVTGSLAFGALARVVLLAARQRGDEDRVLARAKSNIGPDSGGWAYRLAQVQVPGCAGVYNSAVYWTGAVEGSAREIMGAAEEDDEQRSARDEAAEWLREALADGPVPTKELKRQAKDAGLSWRTIQRAQRQAGAVSRRDGFAPDSGWRWMLTQECQAQEDHEVASSVAPLAEPTDYGGCSAEGDQNRPQECHSLSEAPSAPLSDLADDEEAI